MNAITDRQICIVTILLHGALLLDAKLTLYHYPDFFINSSFALLALFLVFVLCVYRRMWLPGKLLLFYGAGVGVQLLLLILGDLFGTGFLGLGNLSFGSGVSLLFYDFCLVCSYAVLLCIQLIKWIIKKITST